MQRNVCFACVSCYIFANCSQTPASTSNLTSSLESQWNIDSNDILSLRKYCQLFTHELNTFLGEQYIILPIQMNGGANTEKSQKQPNLFEARGPPSNTSMPGPTPLNSQMTARSLYALPHNYATKSPLITMGHPIFTPKTTPFPSTITTPSNTPIPQLTPLTSQTASSSNQSFCHSTLCGRTD